MSSLRSRIIDSEILPPLLKQQLLDQFDSLDPERLEAAAVVLEEAEKAEVKFEQIAERFEKALRAREARALKAVDEASMRILEEFEESLRRS